MSSSGLEAFIWEILRVAGPVNGISRQLTQDTVILGHLVRLTVQLSLSEIKQDLTDS